MGCPPPATGPRLGRRSAGLLTALVVPLRGCASRARWDKAGTSRDDHRALTACGQTEDSCLPGAATMRSSSARPQPDRGRLAVGRGHTRTTRLAERPETPGTFGPAP